jgi:hypothetical protein
MVIVGLTGGIGYGKTTFAALLANNAKFHRHWESWEVIAEVANALRHENSVHPTPDNIAGINAWLAPLADIIATCAHCPADFTQFALNPKRLKADPLHFAKLFEYLTLMQAKPELQTGDITDVNRQQFRSLLQWLGGYLVKTVNEGIWYDEIIRRIHLAESTDLELATVGGVRFPGDAERLRNARAYIIEIRRPGMEEADKQDLTERERKLITTDSTVINDGTLEHLAHCAKQVYDDLQGRTLAKQYSASDFTA